MQPAFPVEGPANAVIEVVPSLAGETGHLTQQPEGQPSLQVQPVQAGHVGYEADSTPAGFHGVGPKGAEFFGAGSFQSLGKNCNRGQPVCSTQGRCAPGHHSCQNDRVRLCRTR